MKDSCRALIKHLERYFDRQVTEEEKVVVENHLVSCRPCLEKLKTLQQLRTALKAPVDEALREETFPWVWEKIERDLRSQKEPLWWERFRSFLSPSGLPRKRVWVPAVATAIALVLLTSPLLFKKTPSDLDQSVVEYVESEVYNVMVYESEKEKVTVIWLFEGHQNGTTSFYSRPVRS